MTTTDERIAYSPEDAAAMIGVRRSTIYELMRSGELRSFRVGRIRRITRSALQEWVARQEQEPYTPSDVAANR